MTCIVPILSSFQAIFASGIAFGLTISTFNGLFQVYNERLLKKVQLRLKSLEKRTENRKLFLALGNARTNFSIISSRTDVFTYRCAVIGIVFAAICFVLLVSSSIWPNHCFNWYILLVMNGVAASPVMLALIIMGRWWWDAKSLRNLLAKPY